MMEHQSAQDILIQHIETYRAKKGLSYKELAERLNIPYTTLTEMLRKKRIPRLDTVDMLANAMGVDTYELIFPLRDKSERRKKDSTYEEEVLAAIRGMSEQKRKLLMLYLQLLEESDMG